MTNTYVQRYAGVAVAVAWLASSMVTSACATGTAPAPMAAAAPAGARSDEHAVSAVRDAIREYETALNANDVEAILGLYGRDPVFMPQHAPALVGRDAVRAGYEQVFQTIQLDIRFEIHEVERAGEWTWARTSSAGRTRVLAAGAEIDEGNNELFVFRREDGAWKIHRYLFSTDRPRT